MPEAMRLVREELGDNAIIVANQRSDDGGGVKVTAAVDDYEPVSPLRPEHEIEPPDILDVLANALDRHGVPGELTERLLHAAAPLAEKLLRAASALEVDPPVMTMAAALDRVFQFNPLPDRGLNPPLLMVGPPGSGKTVSVAKLAVAAVLANRQVNVITTDTVRAGGVSQLAAFTRIMDIDLDTAMDPLGLREYLDEISARGGDALTLIDTAGVNPYNAEEREELSEYVHAAQCDIVLVLPAGCDSEEAAEMARLFAEIGATRLLVTRLDAAQRLGSILVAADTGKLQFCSSSITARVADGLAVMNPVSLARLLIPEFIPATSVIELPTAMAS